MFHGRWPTAMVAVMVCVAVSSTDTLESPPFETNTRLPSGCTAMPLLRTGLDAREHRERASVDDVDLARVLGTHVGAAAVGREADAARPRADRDLCDLQA